MELPKLDADVDLDLLDKDVLPKFFLKCSDRGSDQIEESNKRKKLFECEVCFKKLSSKSSLKSHRRIHTGEFLMLVNFVINDSLRLQP